MTDTISQVIKILNDALARDHEAITRLVNLRVDCNTQLLNHPTVVWKGAPWLKWTSRATKNKS